MIIMNHEKILLKSTLNFLFITSHGMVGTAPQMSKEKWDPRKS